MMLFDPKWKETQPPPPPEIPPEIPPREWADFRWFVAWKVLRDPNGGYVWEHPETCAVGEFLRAYDPARYQGGDWYQEALPAEKALDRIARGPTRVAKARRHTWRALEKRLDAIMPRTCKI